MKALRFGRILLLSLGWMIPGLVSAQTTFNSGSTGAYGPLLVDSTTGGKTIALPPDGVLNCTTITVANGYTLSFTKNANNTPIYLLATGDVNLSGYVYLQGTGPTGRRGGDGGPGGFAGGEGGPSPSTGFGPGGGVGGWWHNDGSLPAGGSYRGSGGFGTAGAPVGTGGVIYGNSLLIPLVGGSGGGGGNGPIVDNQLGGGGGGGALLVASNTQIMMNWNGYNGIFATGGSGGGGAYGYGSGGAVRFVAPTIQGTGAIRVQGGGASQAGVGGYGRVRLDALTDSLDLVNVDGSPGYTTFGANLTVFPANLPQIQIISAAGQSIATNRTDPVFVLLPAGSPATQSVTVQVNNFRSVVPLRAVVTPESGDRLTFDFQVDNTAGGASNGTVNVQIPAGVSTRIDVWTR